MIFISHRGESVDAPENTIPAFKLAMERNTSGSECDIHLTRDNVLVTIHDSNTRRIGDREMVVEESAYSELEMVDASNHKPEYSGTKIPRFSETLKYLGSDRLYYVEIKSGDPAVIDAMIDELDKAGIAPEQVVMISFYENIVRIFKERYPERKALLLLSFRVFSNGTWAPTANQLIAKLRDLNADGIDIGGHLNFISADYIRRVKDAGFEFAVWTIDDENTAKAFIDLGVDAITSNCAARLQKIFS